MDHNEARMLASARSDGELEPSRFVDLDAHLAGCVACRGFAEALPQLSVLAAALDREHAPVDLSRRVRAELAHHGVVRRRLPRWRPAPAMAAALVVAIVAVMLGSVPLIQVPSAEAAQALARLTSLYIEREIKIFDDDGRPDTVARERVWFKAPGMVRTETTSGTATILTIDGPGFSYKEDRNGKFLNTGLLPTTSSLPEPLTPTLTLLGVDSGVGPTILGRPTRRISLGFENERREALVDAETFAVLGVTESVVLGKETREEGRLTGRKRTLALEYNPNLDDSLFEIPEEARVIDNGAQPRPLGSLKAPPAGRLEGLDLVAAGASNGAEAILYARGAFQILVEIDGSASFPSLSRRQPARIGSREATLVLPLYGLPEVRFMVDGHRITIRAPLPPPILQELALRMYPAGE
ncbi:MAG: hypothetical protein ACRDKG_16910 [Actinomycetota bacterium]